MTQQTIPLSHLEASAANPRRRIDPKAIEGLAASIRTDGLLQNLVVSPVEGQRRTKRYRVVSGGRRLAALQLLQERGELPKGFSVPSKSAKICPRTMCCASPPSRTCNG